VAQHVRALGVEFESAKVVDNRNRWGSCTPRDTIHLNWRLIKAPMFVIDYVMVHELAHLIESNHTSRFWNIVRAHTPTTEKAKAWLKEHGQVLEEELLGLQVWASCRSLLACSCYTPDHVRLDNLSHFVGW